MVSAEIQERVLLEFSFGENRKESCFRKFPVTINHGNVESFRIVSVNFTTPKIQAMFFRTCSGGHVAPVYFWWFIGVVGIRVCVCVTLGNCLTIVTYTADHLDTCSSGTYSGVVNGTTL